jgi:hypothetical protein
MRPISLLIATGLALTQRDQLLAVVTLYKASAEAGRTK